MRRLSITSLRKGQAHLEEALRALKGGEALHLPSECGWLCLGLEGDSWMASEAPDGTPDWAQLFWPGPLRLRLPSQAGKATWQVPAHPLAQAFLKLSGPVRGSLQGPSDGLWLDWKEPPLGMICTEIDWASTPPRWIRTGSIPRQEVEWAAQCQFLLSGPALPHNWDLPAGPQYTTPSWRVEA